LGKTLLTETERIFEVWHAFKRGEFDRATLRRRFVPLKERFHELLLDGLLNSHKKANGLCSKLLPLWPCLWLFVDAEGVEPTNNTAERGVRPAVLWRKGSFGSQSEAGSTYVARMLTTVGSLRKQGRHVLDFLVAAVVAYRTRAAPPSLLHQ
jgi:transposase